MSIRYRLRTPSTGREIVIPAESDKVYVDRDTGERLAVIGKVTPLEGASKLPFAVEHLRECNWCGQMAQRDLNDCPTCGRRMEPVGA